MSAEEDLSLEAKAREWLDMAQTKWRLQTMQHRSRFNPKTGEYRQLPTRVRRFLNGTPVSMKSRVLEILKESAPYSCPVFDLETGDMKYVPVNTFIRKDGPELTSGGADATYTIVQDLKLLDEAGDTFGLRDESSCAQVGETEWHWDEPDVADCPYGSQGVSYQVANVSRDRETDLFSYAIRKVQSLTVHTQPATVACTERSRVTVETWDNVYGEPGSFRWDPVRGGSAVLAVPESCDRSDGTLVRVSVNRNADCTYRVEVERTEAVTGVGMYYSQHDRYKSETGERTLNAFAPLPRQGVEYNHGVVTRYQSERNEDGTWTNDVATTVERTVTGSTVEERRTPRGTTRTRVDTNVLRPASGVSTEYGSWKSTKTPGGLYTNEYVEHVRSVVDDLGLVCTDTAFMKIHETQGSAESVPSSVHHVPPARNGLVTTWNYDTDAEGLVTKRVRTEQEHTVENAVRRRTWGWLGNTSGYTHRSVSSAVASALLASGNAGTSVEVRMTNGGLFDVEVQTFLRVSGLLLGLDCQKTVYQHVHETAESASEMGTDAQSAGNGKTYRSSYALDTTTGAITKRETVTSELEVPESRRAVRVTARGKTVRTVKSNSPSKPADASSPGQTSEFEVTPGGRYNVTVEETTPREGSLGQDASRDAFERVTGSTRTSKNIPAIPGDGGQNGKYTEFTSRQGDDGLWETHAVTHQEVPGVDDGVEVVVTARGRRKTTKTRSMAELPDEPEADDVGKSLRTSRTRGGWYNVESTEITANPGELGTDSSKDLFSEVKTEVSTKNADAAEDIEDEVESTSDDSGKYMDRRKRLGDDGLWEITDTTHTENEVTDQRVEVRVTKAGRIKRTTDVNVSVAKAENEEPEAKLTDIGKERIIEKTRGGKRVLTKVELTRLSGKPVLQESRSQDAFLKTHVTAKGEESNTLDGKTQLENLGNGKYREKSLVLNDLGFWEERETEYEEQTQSDINTVNYQDAFGTRTVKFFANDVNKNGETEFDSSDASTLIKSVEQELTRGNKYTARITEEKPTEVNSGWLSFTKKAHASGGSEGLSVYYDFIVFRNATLEHVKDWIKHIKDLSYEGGTGSYANHPSINISPNRFSRWDGSIALTTTYTPKTWASGGNTASDNWVKNDIKIRSVNFVPLSQTKLLKIVTTETHKRGGGVGKDKLEAALAGTIIKGSQFSYHPSGQSYSFDIITAVTTKSKVIDLKPTEETIWDGTDNL